MTSSLDDLPRMPAPAARALRAAGYTELGQLAGARRPDLASLHGMGPKALAIVEAPLEQHDLSLS